MRVRHVRACRLLLGRRYGQMEVDVRTKVVIAALILFAGSGLAQVDTLWFRSHQHSPSHPHQFMNQTRTMHVDAAGNTYVAAFGQYKSNTRVVIVLKYDKDGALLWESSCNAGAAENIAHAIAVDDAGAVYVAGRAVNTSANATMLVAKWLPGGGTAWVRTMKGVPTSYHNVGYAIAVIGDDVYVAGMLTNASSYQDMALVKLSAASGAEIWRRSLSRCGGDGYHEAAYDVRISPAKEVFVGGRTHYGSNGYDATIVCYGEDGTLRWQQHINTGTLDEGYGRICLTGDIVAGTGYAGAAVLTAAYRTDGLFQWRQHYAGTGSGTSVGHDIVADNAGDLLVCGRASVPGSANALVVKYRPDGSIAWVHQYASAFGPSEAQALSADDWNSVAVACRAIGAAESPLTVLKFNAEGTRSWVFNLKQPAQGPGGVMNVACHDKLIIASGIVYMSYPNYADPMVMVLHEVPDVAMVEIAEPSGPYDIGEQVHPRVRVRNYSLLPASFGCRFEDDNGYEAELPVDLEPGLEAEVSFPEEWVAGLHGWRRCRSYVRSAWDHDRSNDTLVRMVYVNGPTIDAGARAIVQPNRNLPYETSVVPSATVRNFGVGPADVWAFFCIGTAGGPVYRDSVFLPGLAPTGADTTLEFRPWVAKPFGLLAARCSTWTDGDGYADNDTAVYRFSVVNQPLGAWVRLPDVRSSSSRNTVSKGGGLAASTDRLFVLKGNKTRELHVFDILDENWIGVETVPAGTDGRPVDKGGAVTADEFGRVYVVKGGRSFEFWKYDPVIGWSALADIPAGPKRKSPKGGTGLATVVWNDTGYVYLLKGAGRDEFFRYDIVRDTWDSMPGAPSGVSGKAKYGDGSALAYDGEGRVLCLKGKYNEVFSFDVKTGQWLTAQLPNVPLVGSELRSKKVKHGGDICRADGKPAVLKGGNTCELWRLEPADGSWHEYPPVPYAVEKRKRVKAGAGLEFVAGSYYVTKGNKTGELWRFSLAARDVSREGQPSRDGISSRRKGLKPEQVTVSPNPLRGVGRISLAAPAARPLALALYDAAGRMFWQSAVAPGQSCADIDARRIPAGVYFLVASDRPEQARPARHSARLLERKLIVVR